MNVPKPRKLPSGNWFIQMRLGGESISVTDPSDKACVKKAEYIKAQYRAGLREKKREQPKPEPQKKKGPTLSEAIDAYIKKRDAVLSPSTIRGYYSIKRTCFLPLMGVPIAEITPDMWQTACNDEIKVRGCSAKTLKNAWGFMVSVIADAGLTPPRAKLPQVIPNERPFLEPEQVRPFIAAVHGTEIEIPALLALSSLRRSELLGLQWENVDLNKRTITVKGAKVYGENNQLVQKRRIKTGHRCGSCRS